MIDDDNENGPIISDKNIDEGALIEENSPERKKKIKIIIIFAVLGVLLVGAIATLVILKLTKKKDEKTEDVKKEEDKKEKTFFDLSKIKAANDLTELIIVFPESYTSSLATFIMYIKKENKWTEFINDFAFIGKNGLGCNSEYDVKSPVGIFNFTKRFGIADDPGSKLEYTKVDNTHYWVSDSESEAYNTFVSTNNYTNFNMSISEHLIEYTVPYQYCVNINYNAERIPYKGSAIFLHCNSTKQYTGGCVAISNPNMIKVLKNLSDKSKIIIDELKNIYNY